MVIAGRGARACDVCGTERARWYCAADEAYLCERCDGSVHSANLVASRHERVGLGPNGAPLKIDRKRSDSSVHRTSILPRKKWHRSSKKRSKTSPPRLRHELLHPLGVPSSPLAGESACLIFHPKPDLEDAPLVPKAEENVSLFPMDYHGEEIIEAALATAVKREPSSPALDYQSVDRIAMNLFDFQPEDCDLAPQVPTYEPPSREMIVASHGEHRQELLPTLPSPCNDSRSLGMEELVQEAAPCKVGEFPDCEGNEPGELEASAIEEGSISIDDLSDMDALDSIDLSSDLQEVPDIELWKTAFKTKCERQLEAQHQLPMDSMKVEPQAAPSQSMDPNWSSDQSRKLARDRPSLTKSLSLRLNYEEVLNAWSDRGSLWMEGRRPQTVPDDTFFDTGNLGAGLFTEYICNGSQTGEIAFPDYVMDGRRSNARTAREARVNRYKEKRQTRLYSKKIRYEVRKLNAERRPRMKGRFVKRSTLTDM